MNGKAVCKTVIFFLSLQHTVLSSFCQINPFSLQHVEHITTAHGLADNTVYCILPDKKGFLWFLTGNGLQRYDGYVFKTYCYSPQHTDYIVSGWFNNMLQDSSGIIWIADSNAGLWSFDPVREIFRHYLHEPANENSLSDNQVNEIMIDSRSNIWVATYNGLDEFEPRSQNFKHYYHVANDSNTISNNFVMSLSLDEAENLWLTTASPGVDCFSVRTGKLIHHFNYGSSKLFTSDAESGTYGVFRGRNGNIWIGSRDNGLFCYNTRTKNANHYLHDERNPFSISENSISKIFEDSAGNLWLTGDASGIDFFDNASRRFFYLDQIAGVGNSGVGIYPFAEDRNHNIWIAGTDGVVRASNFTKPFHSYAHIDKDVHSLSNNSVSAFLRDKEGRLFVGSYGVDIMNDSTRKFSQFAINEKGRNIFDKNEIWKIYQDHKGTLWFCTINGLVQYDPVTKKHHWYVFDSRDSTSVSAQSVTGIIEDRNGRYWVTTFGGGLDSFDPKSGMFQGFNETNSSISSNAVGGLLEDKRGMLYIGTLNAGLIRFNPDTKTFKAYRHDDHDPTSISSNFANDFIQTENGIIWVCTNGGGICAFNPLTEKFRTFSKQDSLCSDAAITLVEDNHKNLWIGTLDGISCFTPPADPFDRKDKFHFRNYSTSDGLPMQQINFFASYKDRDGVIYFGTQSAGMFCFKPEELKDNDFIPPVYITGFDVQYHPVHVNDNSKILSVPIEDTKEIKLAHNQNGISFTFSALNYIHPEKNKYAYKLEGYDKDWVYTDATKRFANYTNLNAEEYVFTVKGTNNDGVWNETPATIKIIITPPWWKTVWFRIAVVLTIIAGVYALYRFRLNQLLRLQSIRNKIAHDLHDDIGSTLNSISVFSQVAQQEPEKQKMALDMIGESSRQVIESMSDIVWTINPEHDSFEDVVLRMRSFSYNLLRAGNIEHIFRTDESLNNLKLSLEKRRNFYLFFKEAINNLVKHSEASQSEILLSCENHFIVLTIRDNGKGFDTSKEYNGNGINSMRRRAEDMKSFLSIESSVNSGTTIRLKVRV